MIERPGPVMRWVFARFFREISFPAALAARLSQDAQRGQLVYVTRTLSFFDYLYFTFALSSLGLPPAQFANGARTLLLQPIWRLLVGLVMLWRRRKRAHVDEFAEIVAGGGSALLSLRRAQTLFMLREPRAFRGPYVDALLRLQRERPAGAPPIILVPIGILWGSAAVRGARGRNLIDTVFGERETPGNLRALWQFLSHYKSSQVIGGPSIDLSAFLSDEAGLPDEVLVRRLRFRLSGALESEARVVLGPPRKGSRRISEEVLRSRKVVAEGQAIARDEKLSPAQLEKRARKILSEIAAEPKPWAFDLLKTLVGFILSRIFDGFEVDVVGLERVREAARKGPLILVPSHKSHVDYLLLSYLLSEHDLVPPHIAAGANLSFFPLGFIFRRCGAFFLRRSFKGDRLYGVLFRGYVRRLLRESHNIEFFIEGGRSRTGKLLAPRLGLLGMVVEAALEDDGGHARQAQVVPISIGYEKVIEEKSYARELAGGAKKKEDVKGLLRATRVLFGDYGRINLQFDEPFPLGETLREMGAMVAWDEEQNVVVPAPESAVRLATSRLSHRIVFGINRVTAVTPTALVAAALLGPGRRGVARVDLLRGAALLLGRIQYASGRTMAGLADSDGKLSIDAVDRALDLLQRDGDLEIRSSSGTGQKGQRQDDEIYTVPDERRTRLAYYRNNGVHLFVSEALVALALLGATSRAASEWVVTRGFLEGRTLRLSRLLKREFTYRVGVSFESIFAGTLRGMIDAGLLASAAEDRLRVANVDGLALLCGQVADFADGYHIAASAVAALTHAVTEKELLRRTQELGDSLFFTGKLARKEACVQSTYRNAVAGFVEDGVLVADGDKLRPGSSAPSLATQVGELVGRPGW